MKTGTLFQLTVLLTIFSTASANKMSPEKSDELRIGDSRINLAFITPYTARFELTRIDADGRRQANGEWTDHVDFREQGGVRLLRREVARSSSGGIEDLRQVHLVDATSLAPKVTDQRGESGSISHLDFSGPKVVATILQSSESVTLQVPLEF